MEEETVGVEMDEEMDLEEPDGDGSDVEEEEEDMVEDLGSSPLQQPSSGPGSTPTSNASSPPVNDDILPSYPFTGKPLSIRRGPGRPRKEGKPLSRTNKSPVGLKFKKLKTSGYGRGMPKRVRSMDRADSDAHSVPPSPSEESGALLDPETGALILASDKSVSISEEPPYFIEQWLVVRKLVTLEKEILTNILCYVIFQAWESMCLMQFGGTNTVGTRRTHEAIVSGRISTN